MTESPRIIVPAEGQAAGRPVGGRVSYGAIGVIGAALFCVGLLDLLLLWTPLRLGVPEWEFGTVSRFLDGLPVFTMGTGILIVWGSLEGRRALLWATGILSVVVVVVVLAGALVYSLDIPIALKATDKGLLLALKKGVVKSLGEAVVYTVTFLCLGVIALKAAGRRS